MHKQTTRDRIVTAADELFYRQGYEQTSFADIADTVKISRGNFYYHFRTKDEILEAVIDARMTNTRHMLDGWEQAGSTPFESIRCFIRILIANQAKIMLYGCPVGTLSNELAKLDHHARGRASELFTLFRTWLRCQFESMGHGAAADELALHLLARSQGVATLATAYKDETFVNREVDEMCAWLCALDTAETGKEN